MSILNISVSKDMEKIKLNEQNSTLPNLGGDEPKENLNNHPTSDEKVRELARELAEASGVTAMPTEQVAAYPGGDA